MIFILPLILLAALLIFIRAAGPTLPPETNAVIERVLQNELPEFVTGTTGYASSGGLQIWYESIMPETSPRGTILLVMANGGDALFWPPAFVHAFKNAGYRVIRYDHRGTGMSGRVENWDRNNPYSIADMAGDALAILDTLGIQRAHVTGLSMGGMIAQQLAISHPDRVASLTLIMTSGFIGDPDLPGLSSRYFLTSAIKNIPLLKYRISGGEKNLIKERIAKTIAGVGYEGLDIKEIAEVVLYDLRKRKGINLRAAFQHQAAVTVSGSRIEKLETLEVPTLVIHGTADQIIPVEHGKKLVATIPNAKGLWLEGVGHVFPFPEMHRVQEKIVAHIAGNETDSAATNGNMSIRHAPVNPSVNPSANSPY